MGGIARWSGAAVLLLLAYLAFWPVPIEPVSWIAPENPGYTGDHVRNNGLSAIELLSIGDHLHGPEDVTRDRHGRLYVSTLEGAIVRLDPDGANPEPWADTGGRPLGIAFDPRGVLWVADAYRGLMSVTPGGKVELRSTEADGIPIRYADDVDAAPDGLVYFTDATTRFGAEASGGTYPASLLDIMEHRLSGRLLVYDPARDQTRTVLSQLSFANGVAVSPDGAFLLVNETGTYRVIRYWLQGNRKGQHEVFVDQLPGFPDNISTGHQGRFWVALVSPRNALLDRLSDKPWLRSVVQRLPGWLRPEAVPYGHIVAFDADGKVVLDLQDPAGTYPLNTSVLETEEYLYLGSLVSPSIGRLKNPLSGAAANGHAGGRSGRR
ncbi:MAG: SMP-30/gluconolactonase/LRE family protein [Xanthomonadales bacterium]|nr:SMP-30/gluconolactonase/LRE family protein [Xanthomonadales bacterium]